MVLTHAGAIGPLFVLVVSVGGDLQPSMKSELVHHLPHVALHRVAGDVELRRYFLVAHPGPDELDHLAFSLRHADRLESHRHASLESRLRDLGEQAVGHMGRQDARAAGWSRRARPSRLALY